MLPRDFTPTQKARADNLMRLLRSRPGPGVVNGARPPSPPPSRDAIAAGASHLEKARGRMVTNYKEAWTHAAGRWLAGLELAGARPGPIAFNRFLDSKDYAVANYVASVLDDATFPARWAQRFKEGISR